MKPVEPENYVVFEDILFIGQVSFINQIWDFDHKFSRDSDKDEDFLQKDRGDTVYEILWKCWMEWTLRHFYYWIMSVGLICIPYKATRPVKPNFTFMTTNQSHSRQFVYWKMLLSNDELMLYIDLMVKRDNLKWKPNLTGCRNVLCLGWICILKLNGTTTASHKLLCCCCTNTYCNMNYYKRVGSWQYKDLFY